MPKAPLERVEALFHQAADLAPEQRSTFLDTHCAGDTELRVAVEELLKHDTGTGVGESFLASPVSRVADLPPRPLPPTVPGYELLEELGRGGMGVVYKARQIALNRIAALKMLLSGPAITAEHLARFRLEAEALARLQHPHIVQIFEVGEQEGRPFFSMEYVAGPSLAHQLRGVPQPVLAAARLVEVVARALYAVHRCGIIHRDLKPANILLHPRGETPGSTSEDKDLCSQSGKRECPFEERRTFSALLGDFEPKVSDFGLAKLIKGQPDGRNLTEPGQAMGTPSYMAPEQAWGKTNALGPATDVYALGAILYELLIGRPPFEGETATETILQLLSQEPVPPTHLRSKLPRDLETICLKCLEKEPRKRYTSALALAEDLRRLQAGEPIEARPVSAAERAYRWCRRHPMVAALLAVTASLALALLVTVLVYNSRLQQALAETQQLAEKEREQLVQRDVGIGMRCLEDGDAFTGLLWFTEALRLDEGDVQQEEKHRLRIAMALRQCPHLVQLLVPDEPVLCVQLGTPDPWLVATGQDRIVRVWNVMTGDFAGPDLELDAAVLRAAISPDGRFLATISTDKALRTWDRSTRKPFSRLLSQGAPVGEVTFGSSSQVLLTRRDDFGIQLWDLTSNAPLSLQGLPESNPKYSMFSDDGRWVFIVDADHAGRLWDATTGKALTGSLKLEQDVTHAALSPDGCRVALADIDNQIRIWERSTGKLACGPWRYPCSLTNVAFSPQGDQIITTGDDHAARIWRVATGELLIPPLRHDSVVTQAQFSPDGRLVVSVGSDNKARVWKISTGEELTPPLNHNGSVTHAVFSADSSKMLTIGKDDTARVWELPKDAERGDSKALVAELTRPEQATSPGGRRLIELENGKAVRVMDAVTGAPVGPLLRHRSQINSKVLSTDGRRVLTASDDNTAQVWDAATGERLIPPCQHKGTVLYAAFSPDGRRLITASEDHTARVWDTTSGEPLTPPLKHPRAVVRAQFSPDGSRAITKCVDHTLHRWSLTPDDRPVATLVLLAQVLAGSRIDEKHGFLPLDGKHLRSAWQMVRSDKLSAVPCSSR